MEQVKTHNKLLALVMTMVMALALSMALAPSAFAVAWNNNVVVTAMGGNTGTDAGGAKTEAGQYVNVTMQFAADKDLSQINPSAAEDYLQSNVTIAGRHLDGTTAGYVRDVYDVAVDDSAKTITFKIANNTAGTTANYNGRLLISANSNANSYIATAMGADVETLIGTGVAIDNNQGVLNADGSKTFTISSDAQNRGMVHVLILDGENAIFAETGTFSNGGITVHAHTFINQTVASFASLIASTANGIIEENNEDPLADEIPYSFSVGQNAGEFVISPSDEDGSCANLTAYIYDCKYLNSIHGSVGDITENEYVNP